MKKAPIILTVLFCAAAPLQSDTIVFPEPEAPTTIFSTKLGDADVDVNLQGTWDATASLTTGILFAPGAAPQWLDAFPALNTGPYFIQTPDITASVVLMNRWFLDLSLVQDPTLPGASRSYLTMGYRGEAPDVLRSVVLGSGGVAIPPSGFLEIPDQPASSLGASALLVSGDASNEFLLRWDSTEERSKSFIGPNEVIDLTVEPWEFIRGRFFFLPDTSIDAGSLVVYLQDKDGTYHSGPPDSTTYRRATTDDASADPVTGLVSLKSACNGKILVYYTKSGAPIGDPGLGQGALPGVTGSGRDTSTAVDFSWGGSYFGQPFSARQVAMGSTQCLMLWEPGDLSPFEIDSSYAFTSPPPDDPSRISISFRAKSGSLPAGLEGLSFRPVRGEQRFVIYAARDFRSTFRNMYPLDDPDGLLYGTQKDSLEGYFNYDIAVTLKTPSNEFLLEPNIVPGSVIVTVNGVPETRFDVDTASGKVTFHAPIRDTDRIEIRYRVSSQGLAGGNLLFAWRDTIVFSPELSLSLAAGIRWNIDPRSYSIAPYDKSGTIIAQAGIQGAGENWSYSVTGGLSYTNPDTSGVMRLFGFEGNAAVVDLSEENAYPAAPPAATNQYPLTPPDPLALPFPLEQSNRGFLYYVEYRSYDALGGSSLNPLGWSGAAAVPYADGGKMGPYNVLGSAAGEEAGASLVFDFDIPAAGWVGAQLLPAIGGGADLSTARSVTVRVRGIGVTADVAVYLQAGALAEDIDGDGILQAESSSTEDGFPFYDQAHGITLRVGGGPKGEGNGALDSEDRNGNGILDPVEPLKVVTLTAAGLSIPVSADTGWRTVTIPLDNTARSRLSSTRQLSLIVCAVGGAEALGKILVDEVSFEGAAENGAESPAGTGSISVREVAETSSWSDPGSGRRLQDAFPVVQSTFHANGETQEVLEALWGTVDPVIPGPPQPLAPASSLVVTAYTSPGTGGIQYDTIELYFRLPAALPSSAVASFSLTDADGKGVTWTMGGLDALGDNTWHELRAENRSGRVLIDGSDAGDAAPVFDQGYGSLARLVVTVSGASSGALYLDEVQCRDPRSSFGAALDAEGTYAVQGTILKAGGVPLLSDLSVTQKLSMATAGFATLYGIPYSTGNLSTRTELSVTALFTKIQAQLFMSDFGGSFSASGGHSLTVPSIPFPVALTDAFSLSSDGEFSRRDFITISPAGWMSVSLDTRAEGTMDALTQKWTGSLSLAPAAGLSFSAKSGLSQALSGYPLAAAWYGERWIEEMALVLPWSGGGEISRGEALSASLDLSPAPVGFHVAVSGTTNSDDFTAGGRDQESIIDLSTALLFKLSPSPTDTLTASLGYQRYAVLTGTFPAGERFATDAGQFFTLLREQAYMFTGIPYAELFTDNSGAVLPLWADLAKAAYSPRATFAIQRTYGSRLLDLFLPSSVDVTLGQDLSQEGAIFTTEIFIQPRLSMHAINLFGSLGSHPCIPFARTDEYGLSFSGTFSRSPGEDFLPTQVSVDASAGLEGLTGEVFTVTNSYAWTQASLDDPAVMENTTGLAFTWTTRPVGGVPIPLISPEIGRTAYFSHSESANITLRYSSSGSYHPLTVLIGHSTSLVLPKNGWIKAGMRFGIDSEFLAADTYAYRLVVELKLEAKLSF